MNEASFVYLSLENSFVMCTTVPLLYGDIGVQPAAEAHVAIRPSLDAELVRIFERKLIPAGREI